MVGLTFLICILLILTAVGFLFAWMVRLASFSKNPSTDENTAKASENKTHPPL